MQENINPMLLSPWVGRKPKTNAPPIYLNKPNTEAKAYSSLDFHYLQNDYSI